MLLPLGPVSYLCCSPAGPSELFVLLPGWVSDIRVPFRLEFAAADITVIAEGHYITEGPVDR